ncbi:MAG: glycosyltransferase family 4 protein [Alphaproteobacteria bacterium]|nr:glycosyltransferase family 4 protein [Alphaproteobacteria bacterium]
MSNRARGRVAVLQVVPALDAGGAERSTIDIARALSAAGYRALVASRGGRLEGELRDAGGELVRMPLETKLPMKILANARTLTKLVRVEHVAVIHARSRAPAWSALIAARRSGTPFVTTYHGIYNARTPLKRWYNSVMVRGDAVIANSEWTAEHIRSAYRVRPKILSVIHRGIDFAVFEPAKIDSGEVRALRGQWHADDNTNVVLLPGRLTRWKGQLVLIEALARLQQKGRLKNIRAVFIGDAQGRNEYVREIEGAIARHKLTDMVILAGHFGAMPTAYTAADIVVSASTDPEAFGRVPPEAAAMGKPVIATDHGGARETVLPGVSGLLTRPGDAGALAAAIANLLERPKSDLARMGEAGQGHVRANFSVERMQQETLALYESLVTDIPDLSA